MADIVRIDVGFRGPSGALDLDTVTLATGDPGTPVSYEGGVLSIPQGDRGEQGIQGEQGEQGQSVTITVLTDPDAFEAYVPAPLELVVLTHG